MTTESASLFTTTDYLVVVVYLLIVVVAGSWVGRGQKSVGEYFLAGRSMPWMVVSLSIVSTELSAISYTGVPAWIWAKDLKYTMGFSCFLSFFSSSWLPLFRSFIASRSSPPTNTWSTDFIR